MHGLYACCSCSRMQAPPGFAGGSSAGSVAPRVPPRAGAGLCLHSVAGACPSPCWPEVRGGSDWLELFGNGLQIVYTSDLGHLWSFGKVRSVVPGDWLRSIFDSVTVRRTWALLVSVQSLCR